MQVLYLSLRNKTASTEHETHHVHNNDKDQEVSQLLFSHILPFRSASYHKQQS